ncbi:MAG: hypothetical protein EWV91_05185 [Microcystis aeruginosa Ma_QC_Ca_00000000_S207]|uniref:Uncharacterized protein n=1 Tax=Microcystis aeruginosa Ma_QC_Ca_00000000_S207 TaxID=2486251 RepID=A0A552FXS8_MICAE|nr:MAG: hypothetical protein EWV91_05185 [Microcystis aeruginosa Ma_QC_Ca_00000000_S207]
MIDFNKCRHFQLSVISYQLSVISYQLSDLSFKFTVYLKSSPHPTPCPHRKTFCRKPYLFSSGTTNLAM